MGVHPLISSLSQSTDIQKLYIGFGGYSFYLKILKIKKYLTFLEILN